MTKRGKYHELLAAQRIFRLCGSQLRQESWFGGVIDRYREAIDQTGKMMYKLGVAAACERCAQKGAGSCCFSGVENNYNVVLLLINFLLGHPPPETGEIKGKCLFVGKGGCKLLARHYYCQCFLCNDLKAELGGAAAQCLNQTVAQEIAVGWEVEETLRQWLRHHIGQVRG
jgi:hypothetical protein